MDVGFVQGKSDNLPKVDIVMVADFFMNNDCFGAAETRGVKMKKSGAEQYGDAAVGYVQVKRQHNMCTVKLKVCPEHRIKAKQYAVVIEINEAQETIRNVACMDCAASAGGCKHGVAAVMWLHRRSEEPAPTEVECYWKKSQLAGAATSNKYLTTADFGAARQVQPEPEVGGNFLRDVVEEGLEKQNVGHLYKYFAETPRLFKLSLHYIFLQMHKNGENTLQQFRQRCSTSITDCMCQEAATATEGQCDQPLWHELRYGRVTGSKGYTATHYQNSQTFIQQVIGIMKIQQTDAMKRGSQLEKQVFKVVNDTHKLGFKPAGFMISPQTPFMGASPDGVSKEYVLEIKCPSKDKTFHAYILRNGQISAKCKAQIQLQMYVSQKRKGLFCVADTNFEHNKKIHSVFVNYEPEYVKELIVKTTTFWYNHIFPVLLKSAQV